MGGTGSGRRRLKDLSEPKKLLKAIMPVANIFNEEELKMYYALTDIYLQDFDEEDMTSSDLDDVINLAKNKVLEYRLLKESKDDVGKHLDVSAAIEKIQKQNDKIKENLSTRRKDRIDPNAFKGFSIVDLAVAFDDQKKLKLQDQIQKNKEENERIRAAHAKFPGNRNDTEKEQLEDNLISAKRE